VRIHVFNILYSEKAHISVVHVYIYPTPIIIANNSYCYKKLFSIYEVLL
jgi:hypothetical protein